VSVRSPQTVTSSDGSSQPARPVIGTKQRNGVARRRSRTDIKRGKACYIAGPNRNQRHSEVEMEDLKSRLGGPANGGTTNRRSPRLEARRHRSEASSAPRARPSPASQTIHQHEAKAPYSTPPASPHDTAQRGAEAGLPEPSAFGSIRGFDVIGARSLGARAAHPPLQSGRFASTPEL
jgi:hypothetical protein